MEIHTCLASDIAAFDFTGDDFEPLARHPGATVVVHNNIDAFLANCETADYVLCWDFKAEWYARCPRLKAVFTPAAGNDWVSEDPDGEAELVHGTFHGPIIAESLTHAILFMNHAMPRMIRNFESRKWDRNLQQHCELLAKQTVMIIGLGHIGATCANYIRPLCARVIGIKRNPEVMPFPVSDIDIYAANHLDGLLPQAHHVVTLLPGGAATDRILDRNRLLKCREGAFIYNFGRGNAIATDDIVAVHEHIGGAFLDVVDHEPLPVESPLWQCHNVMITPHSSCVYRDYKPRFVAEVLSKLSAP